MDLQHINPSQSYFLSNYMVSSNHSYLEDSLCCIMANMLDFNLIVSKFKLQLCYYIHFQTNTLGKGMNLLIPSQLWVE